MSDNVNETEKKPEPASATPATAGQPDAVSKTGEPDGKKKKPDLAHVRITQPDTNFRDAYNQHKLYRKTHGMAGKQLDLRGKDLRGALVDEHTIFPDTQGTNRFTKSLEQSRLDHTPYRYNRTGR